MRLPCIYVRYFNVQRPAEQEQINMTFYPVQSIFKFENSRISTRVHETICWHKVSVMETKRVDGLRINSRDKVIYCHAGLNAFLDIFVEIERAFEAGDRIPDNRKD